MEAFKSTRLWQTAFVHSRSDASSEEQAYFQLNFEEMRARVTPIVARILKDMPGYTVHDITHLDALWETASLVAGDNFDLNPAEAFVFGGAVLLHDAAMTIAAYPGGLADLRATTQWKDSVALRNQRGAKIDEKAGNPEIVTEVLRLLHAQKAAELAVQSWSIPALDGSPTTQTTHLIELSDLRNFYGPTIGVIAHSHWWGISKVEHELNRSLGAMPTKTKNTVDLLKIAALLRVADALHLDSRRAPPFVRALDRPTGLSALHWDFQGRLAFPHLEGDSVVFTAGEACPVAGADGWWLAYDALSLGDRELRDSDLLLRENGRAGFRSRRVKGADDPKELARLIPVTGWRPVETKIRVSDVPQIVQTLGGDKLYGSDTNAPLRELIQNALDAVQARRRQQNRLEWGRLQIGLEDREGATWLVVEDDGVGMSEQVLTGTLLDFGTSLWRSSQVAEEFPGLAAQGMNANGRFGIGFFSVFMIADEVRITTRRYDRGVDEGLTLTFKKGLRSRPILTHPPANETPLDGGTKIELKLTHNPRGDHGLRFNPTVPRQVGRFEGLSFRRETPNADLAKLVAGLAPTSDVLLITNEWGKITQAVKAGDWQTISAGGLRDRLGAPPSSLVGTSLLPKLMQIISDDDGTVYGRAALWPSLSIWSEGGALTSGGIRIQSLPHIIGVILGEVTTAARDTGIAMIPPKALARWASEQAKIIRKSTLDDEDKARCAEVILECGGTIGQLPIARHEGAWLTAKDLRKAFSSENEVKVYLGSVQHDDEDGIAKSSFENNFAPAKDVYFIPTLTAQLRNAEASIWAHDRPSYLSDEFEKILNKNWTDYEEWNDSDVVGEVNYDEIIRSINIYSRK